MGYLVDDNMGRWIYLDVCGSATNLYRTFSLANN